MKSKEASSVDQELSDRGLRIAFLTNWNMY